MSFRWLSQENIRVDWDMNPRERDEDYIRTIARHMNENGYDAKFPIVVYQFKDEIEAEAKALGIPVNLYCTEVYHAATGHHRFGASLLQDDEFPNLPLPEVYCEIREGTRSEYVRWMLVDNFQHTPGFNRNIGKTPTRKELQRMRFQLLFFPDVFEKGDRLLATGWGCDHKTVGEVRNWFISKLTRGETPQPDYITDSDIEKIKAIIESDLYLGKDGKKYSRTTKPVEPAKPEPEPEPEDEELDADLKKKLTDIFTMHGSIPVYNPSTQKPYSEELAQDSSLSAAGVYLQINQFKTYIHELEKKIKKSLKQDPRWKPDSLACAMMEDVGVVKTIMANIESHQQFLDKQQQGKSDEAPDPMEKYLGLQETLNRAIDASLFGAINDNPAGKHNIARMLKRGGCYAKGFQQAFLWDNRADLSAEHLSHLEQANVILQEIVIDLDLFTLNHEKDPDKCKVYLNELYRKLSDTEPEPVEETPAEEAENDDKTDYPRINNITISIEKDGKEVGFYFYADELEEDDERSLTDIPKQILDQLLNLVINLEGKDNE